MSVNLSAREIVASSIAASVSDSLLQSGLEPSNLVLEITESAVMKDVEAAVHNLHELSTLGVRIAIDDFGTGYSSLSHLERLPIDILKIDRSFLSDIGSANDAADLAQTLASRGRSGSLPSQRAWKATPRSSACCRWAARSRRASTLACPSTPPQPRRCSRHGTSRARTESGNPAQRLNGRVIAALQAERIGLPLGARSRERTPPRGASAAGARFPMQPTSEPNDRSSDWT